MPREADFGGGGLPANLPPPAPPVGIPAVPSSPSSPSTPSGPAPSLGFLQQWIASNPVSQAKGSGQRVASGTYTGTRSTTGTTFATGVDLLAAAIGISVTGTQTYIVRAFAPQWNNSTVGAINILALNIGGTVYGFMGVLNGPGASYNVPLQGHAVIIFPAGSYSINVRFYVGGGTGTVIGNTGNAGVDQPILVTVEVA